MPKGKENSPLFCRWLAHLLQRRGSSGINCEELPTPIQGDVGSHSIICRAKSWTSNFLSYAGRVQLAKSILFSVQAYWTSLFILPKSIIRMVEQTLRSFIWKGSELSRGGAKVAWKDLCTPKKEGGLGLIDLEAWKSEAMCRHIWHLFSDKDQSMWTSWIRTYCIKKRCFWSLKIPGDCSWTWRKLLRLRSSAQKGIKHVIGNGASTYLWLDDWHPLGPLIRLTTKEQIQTSGMNIDSKVSAVIDREEWRWPNQELLQVLIRV